MKPLAFLSLFLCGCNTVSIHHQDVTFSARVVAWPWQDSQRTIDRLNLAAKGTNFTASLRGLTESETTSTNFNALVQSVVGAAVRAARP